MRRIQLHIDEELDDVLQAEAARTGRSKVALIRECVAARFSSRSAIAEDPLIAMIGSLDAEPADLDDVVYPR